MRRGRSARLSVDGAGERGHMVPAGHVKKLILEITQFEKEMSQVDVPLKS